ncbi:DUF333 domain-containing protein [Neisseria elongata]|uniref:putative hemolysin n=1 Tax=Neisseria elongata TaxID=495 RepID=UPI00360B3F34
MKHLALLLSTAALAACSADKAGQESPAVGTANPASEFCVKQGGKLEMKKDKDGGEYALCHLPDGSVVEEWEYFRSHHGQ